MRAACDILFNEREEVLLARRPDGVLLGGLWEHPGGELAPREIACPVSLGDLFPTLCDVAGIEIPDNIEGTSFKPLLQRPELDWKSAVCSQFHRDPRVTPDGKRYMGYSMVTPRYHYVEWRHWDNDRKKAGELAAVELYDNQADPDENKNMAGLPGSAAVIERLSRKLAAGWRAALPGVVINAITRAA